MQMLSDDDRNIKELTREELDAAWDLWFDLAQSTNDLDPPYTHGVLASSNWRDRSGANRMRILGRPSTTNRDRRSSE